MNNKKAKLLILLLIVPLIIGACASSDMSASDMAEPAMEGGDYSEEMEMDTMAESIGTSMTNSPEAVPALMDENIQDKIIYYVSMNLISDDTEKTNDMLIEEAVSLGGYVGYSNMYKNDGASTYSLQIRIPSGSLGDYKEYADDIAEVEYSNMNSENITEQYYDIIQRLEHEKLEAEQLTLILKTAETIEDILLVRDYLNEVQETIEVYEGRLKLWNSQVDFSTVDFTISPTPLVISTEKGPRLIPLGETGQGMVNVFKKSAIVVANFFSFILRVISALIIPALIVAPIVLLIIFLVKRGKKRKNKANTTIK